MQIALNARILQAPRTGIGHYLAELVNALGEEPDVELSLFHGWGWSPVLPDAALPGYSRMTPVLRQIPGAYQARRWLEAHRNEPYSLQATAWAAATSPRTLSPPSVSIVTTWVTGRS